MIDKVFGSESTARTLKTYADIFGGIKVLQKATTSLASYLMSIGVEACLVTVLATSIQFILAAISFAATLRMVFVDIFGADNTATVVCASYMALCCISDMLAPHDVSVQVPGPGAQSFTIATLSKVPSTFVAVPSDFVVTSFKSPTCNAPGNLLRNGGFEDDSETVPFANGRGWSLPTAPTDPIAYESFDGWQVTTSTNPQSAIRTSDCSKELVVCKYKDLALL